ncbi:MAG: ParB/RepB/Spo0J family partition protein [Acidobacteriota bacterium]|nr:ParB/RepB/Spo0J family partition protein [Acidobacteriota bacterium]
MGRGLAAILAATPQDEREDLRQIPLESIAVNPYQPRRQLDEESLVALAESIRARGVIQPVLVRQVAGGRYELIAGERRWRAAQIAELDTIPAVVRQHEDAASLELAVIENMAREDLNPVDEARACAGLVDELGLTREEVGLRVGRSRVAVSNLIRLLELPDEALELLERRELSEGHGRALLLVSDNTMRRNLARQAMAHGWSVRELESRARAADVTAAASNDPAPDPGDLLHPDRQAAITQIADALGAALGAEVRVRGGARGYTAQLRFASLEEALALAGRLTD